MAMWVKLMLLLVVVWQYSAAVTGNNVAGNNVAKDNAVGDSASVTEKMNKMQKRLERLTHNIGVVMQDVKTMVWQSRQSPEPAATAGGEQVEVVCRASNAAGSNFVRVNQQTIGVPRDSQGWLLILNRVDDQHDFSNRSWEDCKQGFGNYSGSFFLGLESIHRLTEHRPGRMRVDMEDWDGNTAWAEYDSFRVLGETDDYRMFVHGFSGTVGDSLAYTKGMKFTTKDRDNDEFPSGNCATPKYGPFWHRYCSSAKLLGKYLTPDEFSAGDGIIWVTWKGRSYSLKSVSMKMQVGFE